VAESNAGEPVDTQAARAGSGGGLPNAPRTSAVDWLYCTMMHEGTIELPHDQRDMQLSCVAQNCVGVQSWGPAPAG